MGWMPHGGLALANSLATALEAAALFIVMRKRLNGIEGGQVLRASGAAVLAAVVMGLGLAAWGWAARDLGKWVIAPGGVVIGGGLYFLAVWALKVPEIRVLVLAVARRLGRTS
jgi:putative peptidoglycan lipid II flippase